MKKIIFCGVVAIFSVSLFPQSFNYQAALRNNDGSILSNQTVTLRFTLTNVNQQTVYYREQQTTTTNGQGIVNLQIGKGTVLEGTISNVPWSTVEVYLNVELQQGQGQFVTMGASPIVTVPYALYAFSGNQGPAGADGRTILHGTTNPSNSQGQDGDFYINTATNMFFGPKTGGVWPSGISLIGPQGPQGPQGATGPQGVSIQWLGTFPAHPANPSLNQAYYNSTQKKSYIYNGNSWNIIAQDGADAVAAVTGTGTAGKIAVWAGTSTLTNLESLNINPNVAVVSNPTAGDDQPIFEVKNKQGQVVFAVYQHGVRVYVSDDGAKAPKGGFAVGGIGNGKDNDTLYMKVTPDSVKIMFKEDASKTAKGGFLVGGLSTGKGNYDLLKVTTDYTRVFFDTTAAKSVKGGFAVGGLGTNKLDENLMQLTQVNYLIGFEAGKSITTGRYNSFLGYQAGKFDMIGSWNTFLGYQAGMNTTGSDNTFIGYKAGREHTSRGGNVYIGSKAGENAINGERNIVIGESAGDSIIDAERNVILGFEAGYANRWGNDNVFVGTNSGRKNVYGTDNTFIGTFSGSNNYQGSRNVFVGSNAGKNLSVGYNNLFVGYQAGLNSNNCSDNVVLGTSAGKNLVGSHRNVLIGGNAGGLMTNAGYNVFIGDSAGYSNKNFSNVIIGDQAGVYSSGSTNVFIGYATAKFAGNTSYSTFVGIKAGMFSTGVGNSIYGSYTGLYLTTGTNNTLIGNWAGGNLGDGSSNVMVGNSAGLNATGSFNVFLGYGAGSSCNGDDNVFIGNQSGVSNVSNTLIIHNSGSSSKLIWGTFDGLKLGIKLSSAPQHTLHLGDDDAYKTATSTWFTPSDKRLKIIQGKYNKGLSEILKLETVVYRYKVDNTLKIQNTDRDYFGFIAQDVQPIFPEAIETDANGYLSFNFHPILVAQVNATKELYLIIETQQKTIEQLNSKVQSLEIINETVLKRMEQMQNQLEQLQKLMESKKE